MRGLTKHFQVYIFFLSITVVFSCNKSSKPDVSNIQLEIKIQRFDKELFAAKNNDVNQTDLLLQKKYGNFYNDYTKRIITTAELSNFDILTGLFKDKAFTDLNKEVDSVFPSLDYTEKELTESFKYIKYYYPQAKIPQFISYVSGFAYQVTTGDNYMGIGLDMFLGKDSKFYGAISTPRYQTRRFEPQYLLPRVTEVYAREELFPERDEDQTLLSKMIYNGKILYFLDLVLPETLNDSIKIGYNTQQMNWAKKYEGNIWGYFLENDLLYQSDYQKMQTYLTDAPFTPQLGDRKSSAPKLGIFIGWQIVRKYMEENPKVTLQQLMVDTDAQSILTKAKYKPKESL